jgi:putative ABC transport system substrate-binding protein
VGIVWLTGYCRSRTILIAIRDPEHVDAKGLRLLHDLVPKAVRIAVLVNPANTGTAEPTLRDVQEAAPTIGLKTQILNATTIGEIDAAFATLVHERPDALLVVPDAFFYSRARAICHFDSGQQDSGGILGT